MSLVAAYEAIGANKDAEFRVESSISVREQYKTKLRVLINALQPPPPPPRSIATTKPLSVGQHVASVPSSKATTDASKKKQTRDAVADRLRVRSTMPAGKELQVIGDWLLLLRAASVNVVESIAHWRQVIHQDRPVPFEVSHVNYLLQMAHDADFLDQFNDLTAWLGFRLVRNPFIVRGGMDENSSKGSNTPSVFPRGRKKSIDAPARPLPPATLVKPLVSITPDDDVVDGSRIEKAQAMLREEEALYGGARVSQRVEAYLTKSLETSLLRLPEHDDDDGQQSDQVRRTIFDEISTQTKRLRRSQHRVVCLLQEQTRANDLVKLIQDQISWTSSHRSQDLVSDHRVWQYRDKCRASTLRFAETARDQLMSRLEAINAAITESQGVVVKQREQLDRLVAHKDRVQQQRHDEKRRMEYENSARQKAAIRHKTVERNRAFKAKHVKKNDDSNGEFVQHTSDHQSQHAVDQDLVDEIVTTLGAPASPSDRRIELDQKRMENLEQRRQQRIQHETCLNDESREMNRRRDENAQMFLEDRLSWLVEARRRLIVRDRLRKERIKQLTATPICSVVQTIGGIGSNSDKRFVVSAHHHRAKGYAPDGLRFVAYDPSTSTSLSLLVSTREYNALGYGRTLEGLTAFCQWLCIIYEKRKRQFKLVWSGAPCPPPLRLREYDHALVCVHKEGVRMARYSAIQGSSASFFFTAAYIRTNDPSKLRFVVTPVHDGSEVKEIAVTAAELLPAWSLFRRSEGECGRAYISWLHALEDECDDNFEALPRYRYEAKGTRVFSGEMVVADDKQPTRVHIFDVSSTEYELHFVNPRLNELESLPCTQNPIVLLKHEINPYRVRLPGSAFSDLIDCIRLERRHCANTASDSSTLIAHVLPSWRARLARYVRAVRMAKFGCKVDGVFHFVVVTLVQQKTEFRAHLVFEFAVVREAGSRHSLRISLSQLMRCPDANALFGQHEAVGLAERATKCDTCLENRRRLSAMDPEHSLNVDVESTSDGQHGPCTSCDVAQSTRLAILRTLIDSGTVESESALATMYYAVCSSCEAVPPPIAVVIPTRANRTGEAERDDDEAFLSHYFTCFNEANDCTDDGATRIHATLEHSRLCVIRVAAAPIGTHVNAVSIADRVRHFLHLKLRHRLSVEIAVIYRELDIFGLDTNHETVECGPDSSSDAMLVHALRDTATSILQVGQMTPIAVDEADGDQESISNFEGYLVSEALLVEATRVILQPHAEWRVPGETVGASSWSTACKFLRDPMQLSRDLQDRHQTILALNPYARNILDAYTAHPKWPTSLSDVRAPFQSLLSCVLHIMYAQRLLDEGGGLFSPDGDHFADCTQANFADDGIYTLKDGTKAIVIRRQRA